MHEFILTFGYSGKAKKAPGTAGSLASLIFWFLLTKWFYDSGVSIYHQNLFWTLFLVAILIYGILFIKDYCQKFGEIDHKSVVLDETLGQIIALQATYYLIDDYFDKIDIIAMHLIFCFALFRLLDITKPLFIGWCDKNIKNSFGVMFDDLICGFLVAGAGILIKFLY